MGTGMPQPEQHQVLWELIMNKMYRIFGTSVYFFSFLAIVCIVLQALYLNYIVSNYHLLNKRSYLPAYTYILVTSLLPEWSQPGAELFNNWLFLILIHLIYQTYSDLNTRKVLFNIGFVFGLLVLLNFPNFWFLIFIAFAIALLRAYKPAEWMVTLLGVITPLYLFVGIAYLTDRLFLISKLFSTRFTLDFRLTHSTILALTVVLLLSLTGIILLSKQMGRMLFQIKKIWWVNILFFAFAILSTTGIYKQGAEIWLVCLVPASMFMCKAWLIAKPRWLSELFHLVLITAIIYINWFFKG